ncbi:PAS domain S-box protein [Pigmentiphaga aceris]|uniref:Virulence sensor protein BvgS n=1 Tax=Pigmentiphaga aceris TaxID=1940612 RepID=A0A5C0B2I7_9BURK|nr:MHYT domain-containing protein [Pigmentiphaga aceris]QEI08978.1 PAS domain S-box protein [Pigmentiphaga aceris]
MPSFDSLFVGTHDTTPFMPSSHDPWLVALSIFLAIFASTMALQVAGVARETANYFYKQVALASGSMALGCGVWAMHFVGMLAFELCTPVSYDYSQTLLSMLPSLGASWVTLWILSRPSITTSQLVIGGVLVGGGIAAMHYSGMAAMRMAPSLRYDVVWFLISAAVAVSLAILALWIRFGLARTNNNWHGVIAGGVVMGFAIAGMHYTGMMAARFVGTPVTDGTMASSSATFISLAVALISVALTILVLAVNTLLRYRQLLAQMRASESRLRAIVDTAADGLVTMDSRGNIVSINPSAEALFGWRGDELVGRNGEILLHGEYGASYNDLLRQYLAGGSSQVLGMGREVVGRRKDGSLVPIRLAIGEVKIRNQQSLFVAFITDISERKGMEKTLRDREQQYRSLILNIPGAVYRCLPESPWQTLFMSEQVETLTGWRAEEFMDGQVSQAALIHPDDIERVTQEVRAAFSQGLSFVVEYRLMHRDGNIRWIWGSGTAVTDADGKLEWVDGMMLDISERRVMEEDLRDAKTRAEEAAAAKGAFLANMSHEIRTPMNAIIGFTELLLGGHLEVQQRRHLGTVRHSARSLLGLLNDILDTAKLEKGAFELDVIDFSLLELCRQITASLRLSAESKGLQLALDYHPALSPFFKGDPLRIQQIITNLLGNAIKFTDRGWVRLEVLSSHGQVNIRVSDTGVGIAADRLDRIFAPFAQADASMSRRFGGTGLGTTIARQLTELMGGQIQVESQVGVGSVFQVLLPLEAGKPVIERPVMTQQPLPTLRILVADDVPQNLELLSLALSKAGHRVTTARDGAEAVTLFLADSFDVVLMDVQMPGTDGLEATRQIRRAEMQRGVPATPIIALTASVMEEDRRAAREAGMDGFTPKPVELPRLLNEIAQVVGVVFERHAENPLTRPAEQPNLAIDWTRGLELWGDSHAFEQTLRRFCDEYGDVSALFTPMLDRSEFTEGSMRVHRLRGAAANLMLPRVAAVALVLEQAFRSRDEVGVRTAIDGLTTEIAAVRAASALHHHDTPIATGGIDRPGLVRHCMEALNALRHGELVESALQAIELGLEGLGRTETLARLHASLAGFDLVDATLIIEALLKELEPETAEDGYASA